MTSLFPVFPWIGFMGLGYWLGLKTSVTGLYPQAKKLLLLSAALITSAFMLRYVTGFGNLIHWHGQPFGSEFFILSKYPPSLVYILLTLGVVLLLFAVSIHFETSLHALSSHPFLRALRIFGQTSLFFYIVHLYIYGAGAYIYGANLRQGLGETWGVWFLGLLPLYFLCCSYLRLKTRYPNSVLRYF